MLENIGFRAPQFPEMEFLVISNSMGYQNFLELNSAIDVSITCSVVRIFIVWNFKHAVCNTTQVEILLRSCKILQDLVRIL